MKKMVNEEDGQLQIKLKMVNKSGLKRVPGPSSAAA
jgi:hypothetical protein